MTVQLHDTGEEYYQDKLSGESFDVTLFNDSTDSLSDSNDIGDITTEPSGGSFARQSDTFSSTNDSGDWQLDNDNKLTFDTSDSSQSVDSYAVIVNFQSDDKSDGSATDHLLSTGSLSQTYDLSSVDTFEVSAGTAGVKLS